MPEIPSLTLIEILGASASLVYLVLLVKEKVLCWPFGILGSLLSIYLFYVSKLYSEAVLYFFYAVLGVWGWLRWHQRESRGSNPVIRHTLMYHLRACLLTALAALGLGYFMLSATDAQRPMFDAFTTTFSFFATYLEIAKVLEAWGYWVILNLASVWLYHDRALDIYAAQIAIYSVLSVWGFVSWRKTYLAQQATT
ncbi:MAG: nicotinamide riboside transporter PnuC [Halioglobus sp.]